MATKTERMDARLTADEHSLICRAAELSGEAKTRFVVRNALAAAREVVASHESAAMTVIPHDHWDAFAAWLDDEVETSDGLKRLASAEPFE